MTDTAGNGEESTQDRERVERFEVAFNQIHLILKGLAKEVRSDNFSDLLNKAKDKHTTIRYHYEELKQFARLRNAIVHEKTKQDYYIAAPHWEIVHEIEQIRVLLQEPPSALMIASRPVLSYETTTPVKTIMQAVAKKGYSQFPIYDDRQFCGLLTSGGLVRWLSRRVADCTIPIEFMTVSHILPMEKKGNVDFLAEGKSIFDVEAVFESRFERRAKIEALIITSGGTPHESPLGIITPWDLIRLDRRSLPLFTV